MALTRPRYSQIFDTDYKQSVRLATTADVGNLLVDGTITNTVDTITVAVNDRILVKNQNDPKQNGIYRVVTVGTGSDGTWVRTQDADAIGNGKVTSGMTTTVSEGSANLYKTFKLATSDPIVIGTTELTFIDPFAAGAAAGANTQIQFNSDNSVDASANLTFNKYTNALTVSGDIESVNGYFIGDGSQLTGLPESYANTNVAAYLTTYTGDVAADNINATTLYGNLNSTAGTIYVTGNLIPSSNVTYDLGSSSQRWRDGWFSGTTIHIGNESLGVDTNGKWTFTSNGATVEMGASVEFNPPAANISGNIVAGNFLFTNGTAVMSAVTSEISTANLNLKSYVDDHIATINSSNTAMKGYVDSQVTTLQGNISSANTEMKGYVDGQVTTLQGNIGTLTSNTENLTTNISNLQTTKANLSSPTFTGTVTSPNVVVGSNLYVSGSFTVTGNTTTLNTENISINDPLIYMGEGNPSDLFDIGLVGSFTRNSFYQHAGLVRDATDQTWKLFEAVIAEPAATVDFGGAVYSALKLGSVETTGNIITGGNLRLTGKLEDPSGVGGDAGQYLSSTGSGIAWTSIDISTDSIKDATDASNVSATSGYVDMWVQSTYVAKFYNDIAYIYTSLTVSNNFTASNITTSGNVTAANVSADSVSADTLTATNGLIINNNTISANVVIPAGSSAMSVGPISVAPGVTVTIPPGSRHLIL